MATYTAKRVSIDNESKLVSITSGEIPQSINRGDFLCVAQFPPMEISHTYVNNGVPEVHLEKRWEYGQQVDSPAIVIPTTVNFRDTVTALKNANTLLNDNTQAMQNWQTGLGEVEFKNIDGTKTTTKTLKQMELDYQATIQGTDINAQAMLDWQTELGEVTFTNLDGTTTTIKTVRQLELEANNALIGAVSSNNEAITNALNETLSAKAELDTAIEVASETMSTSNTLAQTMAQAQEDINTTVSEVNVVAESLNNTVSNAIDNTQAMLDWQTQLGEVDFLNADGTTTTLKTIKQMELESAQALAVSIEGAMTAITQRDREAYTKTIEAASTGRNSVFWDNQGNPNVMVWINRFNCEDINQAILDKWGVDCQLGTGTHPAFIKQGQEMRGFWYGKYQASESLTGGCSVVDGAAPLVNISFDDAKTLCKSKGENWHMASNSEWAAVAYLSLAHGQALRGNTDRGRAHDAKNETGRRMDNLAPGDLGGEGFTGTGTGPNTWSHDGTAFGVFDLVGNVGEWVDQLKIQDGQIICPNENNDEISEYAWYAHEVYYDVDNLTDRNISLNSHLDNIQGIMGNGANSGASAITPFSQVLKSPEYMGTTLMRQVALECPTALQGLKGSVFARNFGERLPFRGGAQFTGGDAGLAAINLHYNRLSELDSVGFRPALFESESTYVLRQEPRYVPRIGGSKQYYILSSPIVIPENADFKISFYIQGLDRGYEGLFSDSKNEGPWMRLMAEAQFNNIQGYDDEGYYSEIPYQDVTLRDGLLHKLAVLRVDGELYTQVDDETPVYARDSTSAWEFDLLCKFKTSYFSGVFTDFEVEIDQVVVLSLPLTNKEQGDVQLPTVGDITATMHNYTPSVWEREGTPQISYAYADGQTQFWVFDTPIPLPAGSILRYKFIYRGGEGNVNYLHANSENSPSFYGYVSNLNQEIDLQGEVAGESFIDGEDLSTTLTVETNKVYMATVKVASDTDLSQLLKFQSVPKFTEGCIFDVEVLNDQLKVIYANPLTNRAQGEVQAPTVGTISATMANFTPLIWENHEEL
ncbi:hypothetical protein [Pseudoalteromonas phage KB12-38]|nr:hypothetical protein [Pseudoalteromonas phage KB12-38]